MSKPQSLFKRIVATFAVIVMYSLPVGAQDADLQDEEALLSALAESSPEEAKRLDRQLQALWGRSGSASADLLLKRGRDALEIDDIEAAIEHLTALTDHAPDFAEGYHARASAYFRAEMFGPALADLRRALALNPRNYNALYGLGATFELLGEKARAYEAFSRAQAINPHNEEINTAVERLSLSIEGTSL